MYNEEGMENEEYSTEEQAPEDQELPIEEGSEEPESRALTEEEEDAPPVPVVTDEATKKKKQGIGERFAQAQREKYQALDEARRLREENQRLQQQASSSTQIALGHYDNSVNQRMQAAKEQKIKAMESGDIQAQVDADAALSLASAELYDLNMRKAEYESYNKQPQYQQQQQYVPPHQDPDKIYKATRFVDENPWFNPRNEEHDPELAASFDQWCNDFDRSIMQNGRGAEIWSDDYMYELDKAAKAFYSSKHQQRGGDLPMKQSRGNVAPVRQAGFQQNPTQQRGGVQQSKLSAEEREMAKLMKVARPDMDEKMYLQYRMADEQNNGGRRIRGGR